MASNVIGYVVSVDRGIVTIALKRLDVAKYDYVYFNLKDKLGNKLVDVRVIGQIVDIRREPYRLTTESYIADVIESTPQESLIEVIVGKILTLGYRHGDNIMRPKTVPPIGTPVYTADDEDIKKLIEVPEPRGLHIGYLITRPSIPVSIDVFGLRRHLAIIAATGSGKTWTSVLLIEELLKKGATVVVIDPHGEYVPIKDSVERLGPEFRNSVTVIKVAPYQQGEKKYRIDISKIDPETLATLMRIPVTAVKLRYLLQLVHKFLKILRAATGIKKVCTIRNMIRILRAVSAGSARSANALIRVVGLDIDISTLDARFRKILENIASELKQFSEDKRNRMTAMSLIVRLKKLRSLGVYTYYSTPLSVILKPRHVTIINLAGVNDEIQDHVAHHVLKRILDARIRHVRRLKGVKYPYPVVVVVEEAHRFAPPKSRQETWSGKTLTKIACEGRKFGVYLVVITQRPSRIDPDILSQCNSQIILRLVNPRDIDALVQASESIDSELINLIPQLNVGEAIVLGPITPMPLLVRLRDRVLDYGGGDIDVVTEWTRAAQSAGVRLEEFMRVVSELLDTEISKLDAERALRSVNFVTKYSIENGMLSGYIKDVYAEVRLEEKTWTCSKCNRVMLTPCEHVITLLAKAYVDGKLSKYLNVKYVV